jgi:hypothetical protein
MQAKSWATLPEPDRTLLWAMRHMLLCWPTCGSTRAALHRDFGDDGLAVEHLLRCLLTGIGMHARRPLKMGDPACGAILPDEGAILYVIGAARDPSRHAAARIVLADLCDNRAAATLLPLATHLADFVRVAPVFETHSVQ